MSLFDTEKYEVVVHDNVLDEAGNYGAHGYAVVNKENKTIEHTTMMLPGAIYQCQHFNDTLIALLAQEKEAPGLAIVEDIVPEGTILS